MAVGRLGVDLTWSGASGSPGVNVWHARAVDVIDPGGDFAGLAVIVRTFYEALTAIMPSTMTAAFDGEVHGVGADEGTTWSVAPWSVEGTGGADFMPPANCCIVSWKTNSGGRRGRGRTFIGPLTADATEGNGTPGEPVRDLIGAAADDLIESSDSFDNGALGVYSRTDSLLRDFTGRDVPNYFAVLRSRRD